MNNTNTQQDALENLLHRGVQEILPSAEYFKKELTARKLKIYAGIDPTGPTLHIGHAIVIKKLKQFQDLGHEVILLIGDFTATIGDPTDKMATRKVLTDKEIKQNLKQYKKQASVFLRFSGKNKVKIAYNSKWLRKLNFKNMLELTSLMTVDQMLKRHMFDQRMKENKPIYIHEFLYPVLQGYDSVAMGVDVEVGGNDQMFNMMVGRDFLKKLKNKEKTCITMKLLADASGKKMGKTENNMVALSDTHTEMFGKIMSWTDGMILPGFELCTDVSMTEIAEIKKVLEDPALNPKHIKVRLAKEIVSIYHGVEKAEEAAENFEKTFSKGDVPDDIEEVFVTLNTPLGLILQNEKIVASQGEYKRLVKEGAVNTTEGEEIKDFNYCISKPVVVKVGKRRFLNIKVK
ncbi:MAG: tyrosine--tRNA ligase [Candidatus Taylorbacteria bacterium]|nr:tyrosine--tRNA ligase [Candidatus Taylorbacteria bacterium]